MGQDDVLVLKVNVQVPGGVKEIDPQKRAGGQVDKRTGYVAGGGGCRSGWLPTDPRLL